MEQDRSFPFELNFANEAAKEPSEFTFTGGSSVAPRLK